MKSNKGLDVDIIGNQDEPLTEEEAKKLHEYFQEQKKQFKRKDKPESPSRKKRQSAG